MLAFAAKVAGQQAVVLVQVGPPQWLVEVVSLEQLLRSAGIVQTELLLQAVELAQVHPLQWAVELAQAALLQWAVVVQADPLQRFVLVQVEPQHSPQAAGVLYLELQAGEVGPLQLAAVP